MKITSSVLIRSLVTLILITLVSACGGSSTGSNTASNAAENVPKPVEKDIAGEYLATGTGPDTNVEYKSDLTIKKHGEVFRFSWNSAGKAYDGVGVVNGNSAAVSYADGPNGKGCGVVLYQIKEDGSLQGRIGYWGVDEGEVETARPTSGGGLEGSYTIKGTDPKGNDYSGKLTVAKRGEGYNFKWEAANTFEGFGIRGGDMIAVGFGGKQCAFVGYDIEADGTLNGRWGAATSKTFGTEVAKKK